MARYDEPALGIDIDTKLVTDPEGGGGSHRQRIIAVDEDGGDALGDIKRSITDYEVRLDYDARTDGNPVYVGKAVQATATSATEWVVQKLEYDSSSRLIRAQVVSGVAWDDRASSF